MDGWLVSVYDRRGVRLVRARRSQVVEWEKRRGLSGGGGQLNARGMWLIFITHDDRACKAYSEVVAWLSRTCGLANHVIHRSCVCLYLAK